MECIFCGGIATDQILIETQNYKVVFDIDPIQFGHLLIISKNHIRGPVRKMRIYNVKGFFLTETPILTTLRNS